MGAVGNVLGSVFRAGESGVPEADLSDANTSYHYDHDQGTWVCKEDGKMSAVTAAPPPPPPSASPSSVGGGPSPRVQGAAGIRGRYVDTYSGTQ
jgi:hypothetical protein